MEYFKANVLAFQVSHNDYFFRLLAVVRNSILDCLLACCHQKLDFGLLAVIRNSILIASCRQKFEHVLNYCIVVCVTGAVHFDARRARTATGSFTLHSPDDKDPITGCCCCSNAHCLWWGNCSRSCTGTGTCCCGTWLMS